MSTHCRTGSLCRGPDLYLVMRAIGPVAVFGASNFPLAFSTAGGDTASALAAGCPVVVKGHPAHPGTGEIVAQAIDAAIKASDVHPGVFSFIQDSGIEVAQHLVKHPLIAAVGFTGSLAAGRALFDICAAREVPIPFYGELGSINPVFVLEDALANRGTGIGEAWASSLTLGAGQFCTNPGVLIVPEGDAGDELVAAAIDALQRIDPQVMLTDGIASAFRKGVGEWQESGAATKVFGETCADRAATPIVFYRKRRGVAGTPGIGRGSIRAGWHYCAGGRCRPDAHDRQKPWRSIDGHRANGRRRYSDGAVPGRDPGAQGRARHCQWFSYRG